MITSDWESDGDLYSTSTILQKSQRPEKPASLMMTQMRNVGGTALVVGGFH